jgi:predicted transcriptional regulator
MGHKRCLPINQSPASDAAQNADGATDEKAETEQEKNSWIEIELVAEDDSLIAAVKYEIETPDGTMVIGT